MSKCKSSHAAPHSARTLGAVVENSTHPTLGRSKRLRWIFLTGHARSATQWLNRLWARPGLAGSGAVAG